MPDTTASSMTPAPNRGRRGRAPRWLAVTSHVLSMVLSPLLVPTYGVFLALWLSVLAFLDPGVRWLVTGVAFAVTCLLPLLAILVCVRLGLVTDPGLNKRTERLPLYVVTCGCYLCLAWYLHSLNAPAWLWTFPLGGAAAVAVCAVVNNWWKISAHLAGMGGLVALLMRMAADGVNLVYMPVWITGAVLLTGCLASARMALRRHTLGQTLAGAAVGWLAVWLLTMIH